jgi:hypothetical protein
MKFFLNAILAGVVVFFILGCSTTVDYAKKYPDMVANADPVSTGIIEVEFDRILSSKLNKTEIEVVFYPRLNAVALEFRYELTRYRQFWNKAARQQFAAALDLYKADYAGQNLNNQYKKTRTIYGKVRGRTEWETFKYARTRISYPDIELGYRFVGGMPFFTTFMRAAKEESDNTDSSQQLESQQIYMYFTRAQADDLVKRFDQSYLIGLLEEKDDPKPEEPHTVKSYREFGDE